MDYSKLKFNELLKNRGDFSFAHERHSANSLSPGGEPANELMPLKNTNLKIIPLAI